MTVPPYTDDPEGARPYFRKLRDTPRSGLPARNLPAVQLDLLSMGMSHDFEVAIEEGSTCVRIGTAIFGTRPQTMIPIRDHAVGRDFPSQGASLAPARTPSPESVGDALEAGAHCPSRRRPRQRGLHRLSRRIFECSAFVSYDSRRRIQPPKVDSCCRAARRAGGRKAARDPRLILSMFSRQEAPRTRRRSGFSLLILPLT